MRMLTPTRRLTRALARIGPVRYWLAMGRALPRTVEVAGLIFAVQAIAAIAVLFQQGKLTLLAYLQIALDPAAGSFGLVILTALAPQLIPGGRLMPVHAFLLPVLQAACLVLYKLLDSGVRLPTIEGVIGVTRFDAIWLHPVFLLAAILLEALVLWAMVIQPEIARRRVVQ